LKKGLRSRLPVASQGVVADPPFDGESGSGEGVPAWKRAGEGLPKTDPVERVLSASGVGFGKSISQVTCRR
jgi:hypothetical protein